MRKLIIIALAAATAMPTTLAAPAQAQSRHEVRRDRQDVRHQQRQLNRARRSGDRHDVREQRRDVRGARRELREDRRDHRHAVQRRYGRNDWHSYRSQNRRIFSRGSWRAPFRYHSFRPGIRISASYYGSRYYISNPYYYHLPPAGRYQRWVRHYNDVLLIDTRRGYVVDVIHNFYW